MIKLPLPRGVVLLGIVSFLNDTASESIYPLLPTFIATTIGAGPAFIGVLEGLADSIASILKLVVGIWSDRTGKREPFVNAGYALAAFSRPWLGFCTQAWQIFLIRFTDRSGKGLRSAPRDAWLASFTPISERGRVFGFHRAMDNAGSVAGPLLASAFLMAWPHQYRQLFLFSAIPGIFALALSIYAARKYPANQLQQTPSTQHLDLWNSLSHLNTKQRRFFIALALFTLGNSTDAFILLKLSQSGLETAWLPIAWALLHFIKSTSNLIFGNLSDRFGSKPLILLGWVLFALVYVTLGYTHSLAITLAAFFTYGIYYGLTESPEKAWVSKLAYSHQSGTLSGTLFGIYHLVTGLGSLPASVIFGLMWQQFGAAAAFNMGATFAIMAVLVLLQVEERS